MVNISFSQNRYAPVEEKQPVHSFVCLGWYGSSAPGVIEKYVRVFHIFWSLIIFDFLKINFKYEVTDIVNASNNIFCDRGSENLFSL